jgi:hypothetical protein
MEIKFPKITKEMFSKESLKAFGSNAKVLGAAGAGLGAYIGAKVDSDHPAKGAVLGTAAGAGAGIGISTAIKGAKMWGKIGPFGRAGSIIGLSVAVGLGTKALSPASSPAQDDVATNDGMGGYNIQSSGVSSRMRSMNAHGDVVLGLHNKRR